MRLRDRYACLVLAATLLFALEARAQQTGMLAGLVRDAQAAVLPGVSVQVSGPALIGGPRTVVTAESGLYQVANLPPDSTTSPSS